MTSSCDQQKTDIVDADFINWKYWKSAENRKNQKHRKSRSKNLSITDDQILCLNSHSISPFRPSPYATLFRLKPIASHNHNQVYSKVIRNEPKYTSSVVSGKRMLDASESCATQEEDDNRQMGYFLSAPLPNNCYDNYKNFTKNTSAPLSTPRYCKQTHSQFNNENCPYESPMLGSSSARSRFDTISSPHNIRKSYCWGYQINSPSNLIQDYNETLQNSTNLDKPSWYHSTDIHAEEEVAHFSLSDLSEDDEGSQISKENYSISHSANWLALYPLSRAEVKTNPHEQSNPLRLQQQNLIQPNNLGVKDNEIFISNDERLIVDQCLMNTSQPVQKCEVSRDIEWVAISISSTGLFLVISGLFLTFLGSYGLFLTNQTNTTGKALEWFLLNGSPVMSYGLLLWGFFLEASGGALFFWAKTIRHRYQLNSSESERLGDIKSKENQKNETNVSFATQKGISQKTVERKNSFDKYLNSSSPSLNGINSTNNKLKQQRTRQISVPLITVIV